VKRWPIQDAKARFSELIRAARQGPQDITHHGKSVAVILSRDEFDRRFQAGESLAAFMQRSPLFEVDELILERDADPWSGP
jgi:prevent-host-death family protein